MIDRLKKSYVQFMSRVVRPVDYHIGNPVLALMGWQMLRVAAYELTYALRERAWPTEAFEPSRRSLVQQYDREGLLVAPNFFSSEEFSKCRDAYDRLMEACKARPSIMGGYIKTISINGTEKCPDCQYIYTLFANNQFINGIVAHTRRGAIRRLPRITLQDLIMPEGAADRGNATGVLHADRHYHHAKVFFYMNDQDRRDGAYTFVKGSHRYSSIWRLIHEYDLSVRAAFSKTRKFFGLKPSDQLRMHGTETIRPWLFSRLRIEEQPVEAAANSLVMTDNRGFHSRGLMQPGTIRRQVRIQYQYLELPVPARALLSFTALFYPSVKRAFN